MRVLDDDEEERGCETHGRADCSKCCEVCGGYRCTRNSCRLDKRAYYDDGDRAYDEWKDEVGK